METAPGTSRPVLIDRINTLKTHRRDVFGSIQRIGIRVAIVWEVSVRECIDRIRERNFGHKSIKPGDDVRMIVGRTNRELEPLSDDEIRMYHIQKVIRVNAQGKSRNEVVKMILNELSAIYPQLSEITDSAIDKAVQRTIQREQKLNEENLRSGRKLIHKPGSNRDQLISAPKLAMEDSRVKEGRYEIAFANNPIFHDIFESLAGGSSQNCKDEFHITLLFINRSLARYINGEVDAQPEDPITRDFSREELGDAIRLYESLCDDPIQVRLVYTAKNERVMAIRVEILDKSIRFFDVSPHVSIAKVPEAQFRESDALVKEVDVFRNQGLRNTSPDGKILWRDIEDEVEICGRIVFRRHSSR